MKTHISSLVVIASLLCGCGTAEYVSAEPPPPEAGVHNPPSGLCCHITNNTTTDYPWYDATYDCLAPDAGLEPFDPPWLCDVNEAGMCGTADSAACLTCNDNACVVGMSCLGVNGTGEVIACPTSSDAGDEEGSAGGGSAGCNGIGCSGGGTGGAPGPGCGHGMM